MALMRLVSQYPVASYYIVAFTISWGGVLILVGGPGRLLGAEPDSEAFMAGLFATLAGPPIAGLLLTATVDGGGGFRRLLSRLLTWRVDARWYAVALLTAPVSVTTTLLLLSLVSRDFLPGYLGANEGVGPTPVALSIVTALLAGPITGFLEELGWTGFAIPRLLQRQGLFATGVLVGLLWGAWHLVSNLWGSEEGAGTVPLVVYIAGLLFTFLPPYRVLMVWLYDRTNSLLLAMVMHASLVIFWLVSTPQDIEPTDLMVWYAAWGLLLWGMVAAVASRWLRSAPGSKTAPGAVPSEPGVSTAT